MAILKVSCVCTLGDIARKVDMYFDNDVLGKKKRKMKKYLTLCHH
jgi:hypothetical protein